MKNIKLKFLLGLLTLIGLIIATTISAESLFDVNNNVNNFRNNKTRYIEDEVIVKFKGDSKPFRVIKIPKGKVFEEINQYRKRSDVVYTEPNYIVNISLVPNDPNFPLLYGLNNTGQTGGIFDADIDAPEAWDKQIGTSTVLIAVIDTGVDYNHEDLAANIWTNPNEIPNNGIDDDGNGFVDDVRGWNFYSGSNDPFDDYGHGTHCAGIIGALGNNGKGVVGVNWNIKILPIKFLGPDGSGTTAGAAAAIDYAISMGANIMSNSWGGGGYSQTLKDAIEAANKAGILFVVAAGNSGSNNDLTPFYPASYDNANIISVAATDNNDQKASWSNYGANSVDIGAPGVNIFSTVPVPINASSTCPLCDPSGYKYLSGTSMATPYVSGVAGLIKTQFPALNSDGIKSRLLGGTDPIASLSGITVTAGRLNANNVLETDNIPPAAVTDLSASNPTIDSITLNWTATGDDGNVGTASFYDLRYSTSPISDANWDQATKVINEPKPQAPGSIETFTVKGLLYSTTYYFALKVIDNVSNSSGLSNLASENTKVPLIIFQDNMESGVNGWTYDGLWHQENYKFYSSTTSWAYNTGSPNYNYNTGVRNSGSLTSPNIDLSGYKSAVLEFWYWYETENSGTTWDQRWVQISVNGSSTSQVQLSNDPMKQWNKYTLDLSQYAGNPNVQIKFFFDTMDSVLNSYEGWYIDNVMVYGIKKQNNPPVANNQSVVTNEDVSLNIVLTGSDPDNDPITFKITSNPVNGIINLDPNFSANGKLTYTSSLNFNGTDTFAFTVNDGKIDSRVGTVSIKINPVNDAPVAYDQSVETNQNTPVNITLKGSDVDGDVLDYSIVSTPPHGSITFTTPNITYTPGYNYVGTDSFTFRVRDSGMLPSNIATVTITIKQVAVKCWSASYKYLYLNANQAKKFCECAQGTYGYNKYKYSFPKQTVYRYTNTGNNTNWSVTSLRSYNAVYEVTCKDGKAYPTNKDYFYPK